MSIMLKIIRVPVLKKKKYNKSIMKKERIIYDGGYSYNDYLKDCSGDENVDLSIDGYHDYMQIWAGDERRNLDETLDGVVVVLCDIGTWRGRIQSIGVLGNNLNDVLRQAGSLMDAKIYCDRHNVRCDGAHHDGRNYYLFRLAKSKAHAEWIQDEFMRGSMSEHRFSCNTKSLRPHVSNIYGW